MYLFIYLFKKQLLTLTKCQGLSWASTSQTVLKDQFGVGCFNFQFVHFDTFVKYNKNELLENHTFMCRINIKLI